mgnify:CR=1 FL=1
MNIYIKYTINISSMTKTKEPIKKDIKKVTSTFRNNLRNFLVKNNIIPLAMGVIIGVSTQKFIKSFVNDIVMKFLNPLTNLDNFSDFVLKITPRININLGAFLASSIYYIIVLVICFYFVNILKTISKIPKDKKVTDL